MTIALLVESLKEFTRRPPTAVEVQAPICSSGTARDERALRDLVENLQARNRELKLRLEAEVRADGLEASKRQNRALESVLEEVWQLFDENSNEDADWVDAKRLAKYRDSFRRLLDDPDYRNRTDRDGICNISILRQRRVTRVPSASNVLLMWADERRKRECAEQRLDDARQYFEHHLIQRGRR